jgi:hypothetical protein
MHAADDTIDLHVAMLDLFSIYVSDDREFLNIEIRGDD